MSLSASEKKQTSFELKENMKISGLSQMEIQFDLSIDEKTFISCINMHEVQDPANVWRIKDYLEKKIKQQGKTPYPYSKLINNIWYRYD